MEQGIVHVIGPELGYTQPGKTIVCGDSHTSTHGALGALAFGIGTSEVEHVLATQCLQQHRPKPMRVTVNGRLPEGVTAKDLALAIIGKIGTDGGTGHAIEYAGEAVRALSMEGRMTLCNLTIESGARAGMVAPDETTFALPERPPRRPQGRGLGSRRRLLAHAGQRSGSASSTRKSRSNASELLPHVTWGTNPGNGFADHRTACPIRRRPPTEAEKAALTRALEYMALKPGTRLTEIAIDRVFIGSCTNGRIEDLRAAARVLRGYKIHPKVQALIVPGSQAVKTAAEQEGLRPHLPRGGRGMARVRLLHVPGHEPRHRAARPALRRHQQPQLRGTPGQGRRARIWSRPAMAAAAAVAGHFTDVRSWQFKDQEQMKPLRVHQGHRCAAAQDQHRHRPDHPQAVSEAHRARRVRKLSVLRLALPARRQLRSRRSCSTMPPTARPAS